MAVSLGTAQPAAYSFKRSAIHGAIWTLLGFGVAQCLRLGSNVVATRLLGPDAFGLMAIVTVFTTGLTMFSDIGVGPAIIQHRRGEDARFLCTAWTLQALRGVLLGLAMLGVAWPIATLYAEPLLGWILPLVGVKALLEGFNSTALATANRKLLLGRLTTLEVLSQLMSVAVMLTWAWFAPSVWALVSGGLAAAAVKLLLSHAFLPGVRHRLRWDPQASRDLVRFGRWIFVSTAFTFLVSQGDRLVLSTFVPVGALGIYYIAVQLAQSVVQGCSLLSSRVLFPLYARMAEDAHGTSMRPRLRRVRIWLLGAFLPLPCALMAFGPQLVQRLFGSAFAEAGSMLPLLSVAAAIEIVGLTVGPVILAHGDSFRQMLLVVIRGLLVLTCAVAGAALDGMQGLIVGLIVAQLAGYPVLAWAVRKYRAWMPWVDVGAALYCAGILSLFSLLQRAL